MAEQNRLTPLHTRERRDSIHLRIRLLPSSENRGEGSLPFLLLVAGTLLTFLLSLFAPVLSVPAASGSTPTPPYPTSQEITVSSIDSAVISIGDTNAGDNWPSTWADDDLLYTYLADGTGFGLSSARSMAPASISGSPSTGTLFGHNINTNSTGTATGGGPGGRKVSGLIALPDASSPTGHVLYAWVRNISSHGGASLMYSYDSARTWTWAWGDPSTTSRAIIPELGYPTWMQAGKNNAAAQDPYLYFYSQDAPTAYRVSDTVLLGRVEQTRVKVKSAYQYFAGLDCKGTPIWTSALSSRKPVFSARGQSYRVFVTYHPILKRYFLLTANGDSLDSNWRAGKKTHNLGIYEARTPWGPWSTIYYNDSFQPNMNVFAPQMVSKWIAADGTSFYLLYSSYQAAPYKFNLQNVHLNVKASLRTGA